MQITTNATLNLQQPDYSVIYEPQGNQLSRFVLVKLMDGSVPWTIPENTLVLIRYKKPDGTFGAYDTNESGGSAYSVSGSTVTIELVSQMLTVAGNVAAQIDFYNAAGQHLSTFSFRVAVEASPITDGEIESSDYFNVLTATLAEAQQIWVQVKSAYGAPRTANTSAAMTDKALIYVYTGTTTSSLTNGHWYYWNGSAWTDGGTYNSTAFETDPTLSIEGAAADAKAAGDKTDYAALNLVRSGYVHIPRFYVNQPSERLQYSASGNYGTIVLPVTPGERYIISKATATIMRAATGTVSGETLASTTSNVTVTSVVSHATASADPLIVNVPQGSSYLYIQLYANTDAAAFRSLDANIPTLSLLDDSNTLALMDKTGTFYTNVDAVHSWVKSATPQGGAIKFTIGGKLVPRLRNVPNNPLLWADIITEISDYVVISGEESEIATITIPVYHALVYNPDDGLLHLRDKRQHNDTCYNKREIVIVYNTYNNPLYGNIVDEYNTRRIAALEGEIAAIPERSFNAAYHTGATNFVTKCQEFASLFSGTTEGTAAIDDYEAFLWFTDPHLLETRSGATNENPGWTWQPQCIEFMAEIQKYANSTPVSFTLCGGDWIGNSDYPTEAAFKLGYVNGFMRALFGGHGYTLTGNHDTNDQGIAAGLDRTTANRGTTRLTTQAISNLLYTGGPAYFTVDGRKTKVYCLDTGAQNQTLAAFGNYGYDQLKWLADGLAAETSEHIILAAHILYVSTSQPNTYQPLTSEALKVCQAFNARSTFSLSYGGNTYTYNFSDRTGKVEFGLMGHTHEDTYRLMQPDAQKDPILCVVTDNVRQDVSLGPTFDLVCADYSNRRLRMVRVGYGADRTFDLDTGAPV